MFFNHHRTFIYNIQDMTLLYTAINNVTEVFEDVVDLINKLLLANHVYKIVTSPLKYQAVKLDDMDCRYMRPLVKSVITEDRFCKNTQSIVIFHKSLHNI